MAAQFYSVTRNEMHQFLTGLGFLPLALKGVVELVYAKIVHVGGHHLSLRIYTAVNPNGESREKGTDAIRVQLFAKVQNGGGTEVIMPVGKVQKCLRVQSWRENLGKAIARTTDSEHFRLCPACGHPMVLRENRTTGEEFWGCSRFRIAGCNGRQIPQSYQERTPLLPKAFEELPPWEQDDLRDKGQL
jgi:hypothetical protein